MKMSHQDYEHVSILTLSGEYTEEDLEHTYDCPIDLIAHGVPHRVLHSHD